MENRPGLHSLLTAADDNYVVYDFNRLFTFNSKPHSWFSKY